jgi:hypothetical protein
MHLCMGFLIPMPHLLCSTPMNVILKHIIYTTFPSLTLLPSTSWNFWLLLGKSAGAENMLIYKSYYLHLD